MALPLRKQIINNIETTLETIRPSNGYRVKVTKVERIMRHWDEVNSAERPWVGFFAGIQLYQHQPFNTIRIVMPVVLMAYMFEKDTDIRQDILAALEDDLVVALNADITRGGCATSTTIKTIQTDEGDDDGHGIIKIEFDIVYYRTTGAS